MAGWTKLRELVEYEFTQAAQEGRDRQALERLRPQLAAAGDDKAALSRLWDALAAVAMNPDFPFREPDDLAPIRSLRPSGPRKLKLAYAVEGETMFDRMYGAWLGRCAGCALGKPVENFMGGISKPQALSSKERIKQYLLGAGADEYPLRDYFPGHSKAEDRTGKLGCGLSHRENIKFMETDDDIRYTVLGQVVMRQHGRNFTTADVAGAWLRWLPYRQVCTAETQAYRNLVAGYDFHLNADSDSHIDWHWIATYQNPYREWIGAQIRADSWGYAAPGSPELAAEFAWRDARLSHVKNGIYGEMLVAAMIAAAFALDDPLAIVQAGLAEIPHTSRLHADVLKTIDICRQYNNSAAAFEKVLDDIYAAFGHYHPVHTNNNAALVVASLLLGGHDFEKVITIAVMGGWDSDCNGATAGSIVGAMLGAKKLPGKWIEPLHDTLYSEIIDYHPIAISECARRSVGIARAVMA